MGRSRLYVWEKFGLSFHTTPGSQVAPNFPRPRNKAAQTTPRPPPNKISFSSQHAHTRPTLTHGSAVAWVWQDAALVGLAGGGHAYRQPEPPQDRVSGGLRMGVLWGLFQCNGLGWFRAFWHSKRSFCAQIVQHISRLRCVLGNSWWVGTKGGGRWC